MNMVEKLMVGIFEARFEDELSKTHESDNAWAWMKARLKNVVDADKLYEDYRNDRLKEMMEGA